MRNRRLDRRQRREGHLLRLQLNGTSNRCPERNRAGCGVHPAEPGKHRSMPAGQHRRPDPHLHHRQIALGGYRCQVLQTGLQCAVIASGKGFLFGPTTVTPVGGATLRTT
jgi:hypothetical protein